ncbi:MAG: hypothetical protein HUJ61_02905 [Bacilli bacterium]|nr:hypothetical protein [Bacilli bacterium]
MLIISIKFIRVNSYSFNEHISFSNHIKKVHKLSIQSYYDTYLRKDGEGICKCCGKATTYYGLGKGYSNYCSSKCCNMATAQNQVKTEIKCLICNETVTGTDKKYAVKNFTKHLQRSHNIYEPKIYYDTYIRQKDEGICPICKKETEFNSIISGYNKYCSVSCQQNHLKNIEGSHTNKLSAIYQLRHTIKNIIAGISEKYKNFIKNDKRLNWSDIRTDSITHNNIKDDKSVETLDGIVEVKTEISCSTERDFWVGTQHKYIPKQEHCTSKTYIDEIIDCDNSINENEWCH